MKGEIKNMAKISKNNNNSIDTVVKMIKNHTKEINKNQLSQEEVYDYLNQIKVDIPDESMDDVLEKLMNEKIISHDGDDGDLDDISNDELAEEGLLPDETDDETDEDVDQEETEELFLKNTKKDQKRKSRDDDYTNNFDPTLNKYIGSSNDLDDEDSEYSSLYDDDDDYSDESSYADDEEDFEDFEEIPTKNKKSKKIDTYELKDFDDDSEITLELDSDNRKSAKELRNKLTETNDIVK